MQMNRTDHITILAVALVGVVGVAVEVLTLLDVQEWIKFAVAVVTFAVILLGTYWFVLAQGTDGTARGLGPAESTIKGWSLAAKPQPISLFPRRGASIIAA